MGIEDLEVGVKILDKRHLKIIKYHDCNMVGWAIQ